MPLAMGYVPWQTFECTYEPMQGLRAGTIFPELDKPFYGRRGMR
ncbi:MAG: spore coat associated protein CotJA [Agathobacter sp.]|nr:spore coat associated protein CotJA [Agathobacter sp.]